MNQRKMRGKEVRKLVVETGTVIHAYNPSIWEVGGGRPGVEDLSYTVSSTPT